MNAASRTLQYLPRHRLTLDAWQPLTDKLSLFGSLLYVTDQTYYSRTGTLRSAELPSYVLVNTRLSYDLDKKMQLYVGIDPLPMDSRRQAVPHMLVCACAFEVTELNKKASLGLAFLFESVFRSG